MAHKQRHQDEVVLLVATQMEEQQVKVESEEPKPQGGTMSARAVVAGKKMIFVSGKWVEEKKPKRATRRKGYTEKPEAS